MNLNQRVSKTQTRGSLAACGPEGHYMRPVNDRNDLSLVYTGDYSRRFRPAATIYSRRKKRRARNDDNILFVAVFGESPFSRL